MAQRKHLGFPKYWEPSSFKWKCLCFTCAVSCLRDSASHNTMQLPSLHGSDIVRFMHYMRCWKRAYSLKPSDESFSRNAGNDDEYSCPHRSYCFPPKQRCAGLVMCTSRRKGCAVSPPWLSLLLVTDSSRKQLVMGLCWDSVSNLNDQIISCLCREEKRK